MELRKQTEKKKKLSVRELVLQECAADKDTVAKTGSKRKVNDLGNGRLVILFPSCQHNGSIYSCNALPPADL